MGRALPVVSLLVAFSALGLSWLGRSEPAPPSPVAEVQPTRDESAELRRRVEQLEDDNRALWDRVALLERRQPGAVPAGDGGLVPAREVAQLREELRSVMTGEVLTSEAGRAALKDLVREAQVEQQREREASRQQRQQLRAAELRERWKGFVTTAKLTWAQEQKLTERLDLEEALRTALQAARTDGQAPAQDFRKLRETQRETDQVMHGLLDEAQRGPYDDLRREERPGRQRGTGGE